MVRAATTRTAEKGSDGTGTGRERVLREARALFLSRGYDGVSMQEVADAVGVTKAALYYHFPAKEQLLAEVAGSELERVGAGIERHLAGDDPLQARLERVARFLLNTGGANLGRLLNDLDRHLTPAQVEAVRERFARPQAAIHAAFEDARDRGEIRSVDLTIAISLFFAMIFGRIRRAAFGRPAPADPATLAAAIADMTLNGIGTHHER